jgi:transcription initiation factor TFIIIB Brf1 subunit/transcription initiation factor TFIIB
MPKQCPVCGYDFDDKGNYWICHHCGFVISKNIHKGKGIHNIRNFNPSSRDNLDVRPEI